MLPLWQATPCSYTTFLQMVWTTQCISSTISPQESVRLIHLRGNHSCTLDPAGHRNPRGFYWRQTNQATSGGTEVSEGRFWLQDHWAGSPGAVTLPWCGHCHRQQRWRPLLQFPSQRSMWKQSLRQRPRLFLHCWLSERPLAAGETGQETYLGELEPASQSPKSYWELHQCWWLSNVDVLSW